jgi:hypothetical protein
MPLSLLIAAILAGASPAAQNPDALAAALRTKDQALLDAIATGHKDIWERTLTPDAVYIDENGAVMDRGAYLASLVPLPRGASGHLTIVDYRLHRFGDTALVVHWDDEREDYHGVPLHADYLMSETWLRMDNDWRLAMVHAYVVAVDPPSVPLPPGTLESYAGNYKAGEDLTYSIQRQGDHLVAGRTGGAMRPLLAEAPDLLFTPGQPRLKRLFQRDAGGRVVGFIDRREGEDIVWRKAPAP